MRAREGPTKNLFLRRQRNAQQDTKAECLLLVYFVLRNKSAIYKLGRFSRAFAEINVEMSLKLVPNGMESASKINLHPGDRKIKLFPDFF